MDAKVAVSFYLTDDPARAMPLESKIEFASHGFVVETPLSAESPMFGGLTDWTALKGTVLLVMFGNVEKSRVSGTAVMVAPGIALCARHVLSDQIDHLMNGSRGALCIGIAEHGAQAWRINKVVLIDNSDLAILSLTYASALPPGNKFYLARLSTRLPKIGERLLICGFVPENASIDEIYKVGVSGGMMASIGILHFSRKR